MSTEGTVTDILIPTFSDKEPIIWDDNNASLEGVLYEVKQYLVRKNLFAPLLQHRAVALSNGKLAVDNINSLRFISGGVDDPRDFDDPCPPTVRRIQVYNAALTAAGGSAVAFSGTAPAGVDNYVVQPYLVQAEDGRLLTLLMNVIGGSHAAESLSERAQGSGVALLGLLRTRAAAATGREKAVVTKAHQRIIMQGVIGMLCRDATYI